MYLLDYDDTTPSVYENVTPTNVISNTQVTAEDVFQIVLPYVKTISVFNCPERTDSSQFCGFPTYQGLYGYPTVSNQCLGYGYNWGFIPSAGGALFNTEAPSADGNYLIDSGVNATTAETPADFAVWGDTTSVSRYTISAVDGILSIQTLASANPTNSLIRHNHLLNFSFLDGHAKSVPFKGGTLQTPAGPVYVGVPANDASRAAMYCMSPDANVNVTALLPPGSPPEAANIPCSSAVFLPDQSGYLTFWTN